MSKITALRLICPDFPEQQNEPLPGTVIQNRDRDGEIALNLSEDGKMVGLSVRQLGYITTSFIPVEDFKQFLADLDEWFDSQM